MVSNIGRSRYFSNIVSRFGVLDTILAPQYRPILGSGLPNADMVDIADIYTSNHRSIRLLRF